MPVGADEAAWDGTVGIEAGGFGVGNGPGGQGQRI